MSVLAVDLGGTNIRSAIFDSPTCKREMLRLPHRELGQPLPLSAFVQHLRDHLQKSQTAIQAIGVSVAAVVDHRTGYVKVGENIGWRDVPLGAALADAFGLPVAVDGDAFCGAWAEAQLGAGQDEDHFLYIAIGTGIGHALVLNRAVWHGQHGAANVFGHLKVAFDGPPCYCGGVGCVCQYASGKGLARLGGEHQVGLRGEDVITYFQQGEVWANAVLQAANTQLAHAISHAYNLLDLECTIIGGGATSAVFPDFLQLHRDIELCAYPAVRPIRLKYAALGSDDVLTGAALRAFEKIDAPKTGAPKLNCR